jgi:hypothetical protein
LLKFIDELAEVVLDFLEAHEELVVFTFAFHVVLTVVFEEPILVLKREEPKELGFETATNIIDE